MAKAGGRPGKKARQKNNPQIQKMPLLTQKFFEGGTVKIAESLLGCFLARKTKEGKTLRGRIVETEAYLGIKDPCCHSFRGRRTERTKTMYLPGGHAYIYFTYGMHHCFNAVTARAGAPEAVLIRALEPLSGLEEMAKNRGLSSRRLLASGPGRLCQAMDLTRDLNGARLWERGPVFIERGEKPASEPAMETAIARRIGLPPGNDAFYWPLRFYIKNSPYVSVRKDLP